MKERERQKNNELGGYGNTQYEMRTEKEEERNEAGEGEEGQGKSE
jgi:hypothetical protein